MGGELSSIDELRSLPIGTIVGQVIGSSGSMTGVLSNDSYVNHGGIIVMHDFGDGRGPVKAIYQSCGNILGGPQHTRIEQLGNWNV